MQRAKTTPKCQEIQQATNKSQNVQIEQWERIPKAKY